VSAHGAVLRPSRYRLDGRGFGAAANRNALGMQPLIAQGALNGPCGGIFWPDHFGFHRPQPRWPCGGGVRCHTLCKARSIPPELPAFRKRVGDFNVQKTCFLPAEYCRRFHAPTHKAGRTSTVAPRIAPTAACPQDAASRPSGPI
jgi:hypothetical protein